MPRTVLVVPCYNEASRLDVAAFEAFLYEHGDVGVRFVDDGSQDGTAALLESLVARDPTQLAWTQLPVNRGKGEAVRTGVLAALDAGAERVGYWDADLATPLSELPRFETVLDERPECDVVLGARVSLLGRDIRRSPLRHYLGRVFATVAASALGLSVYDTQCGAKLFRARPGVRALFDEPFISRWIFDVEILARLVALAARDGGPPPERRVYELPLSRWEDVADSRVRGADFPRAALELGSIVRHYGLPPR